LPLSALLQPLFRNAAFSLIAAFIPIVRGKGGTAGADPPHSVAKPYPWREKGSRRRWALP